MARRLDVGNSVLDKKGPLKWTSRFLMSSGNLRFIQKSCHKQKQLFQDSGVSITFFYFVSGQKI